MRKDYEQWVWDLYTRHHAAALREERAPKGKHGRRPVRREYRHARQRWMQFCRSVTAQELRILQQPF